MRRVSLGALVAGLLCLPADGVLRSHSPDALHDLPPLLLWAWERPEDLSFIDPATTAVAYLAGTLRLGDHSVQVRPRLNPLAVPPSTRLVAVVRIETAARSHPSLDDQQLEQALTHLKWLFSKPDLAAVQLDFDATRSQRPFYRRLLEALRHQLPPHLPVSITALASWCLDDPWIQDLPIDEAVPMLFDMGPETAAIHRRLEHSGSFTVPRAGYSIGVSTREWPPVTRAKRTYVFHPRRWDAATYESIAWLAE